MGPKREKNNAKKSDDNHAKRQSSVQKKKKERKQENVKKSIGKMSSSRTEFIVQNKRGLKKNFFWRRLID